MYPVRCLCCYTYRRILLCRDSSGALRTPSAAGRQSLLQCSLPEPCVWTWLSIAVPAAFVFISSASCRTRDSAQQTTGRCLYRLRNRYGASVCASQINSANDGGVLATRGRPSNTEVTLNEKQVGWSLVAALMPGQLRLLSQSCHSSAGATSPVIT